MKLNIAIPLSLILVIIAFTLSCKTSFEAQVYRFILSTDSEICDENEFRDILMKGDVKSITLKNDSILEYWKRYSGLGSSRAIKYTLLDNELIVYPADTLGYDVPGISNMCFYYNKDSIINEKTKEKYYNQKYLDKISKQQKQRYGK